MTKSRIFFWLLVSFIVGVAAASYFPIGVFGAASLFVVGGAVTVAGAAGGEERRRLVVVGAAIAVVGMGSVWFLRSTRPPDGSIQAYVGERVTFEGTVQDEPGRSARSQRLTVEIQNSRYRLLVLLRPFPEYRYGDRLRVSGMLEEPENFSDTFDYRAYLAKDDIYWVMAFPEVTLIGRDEGTVVYRTLFMIKRAFSENLERALPEPYAAFLSGLLLGERRSLPPELTEELQATGTSHIVALSGYNITIVGDALVKTFRFLTLSVGWSFGMATLGIVAFTLLTGAQASVVRAAIMGVLVLIARREGRRYQVRNALLLAAALMLIANPRVLRFDVGFQLSFLATLGLVYGTPILERGFEHLRRRLTPILRTLGLIHDRFERRPQGARRHLLADVLSSTLAAQLAVLPLIVYHFGRLSLVSPLANLAILPVIPYAMLTGFLTGSFAFTAEVVGSTFGWVSSVVLAYLLGAIHLAAQLPGASVEIRGFGLDVTLLAYALVLVWLWNKRHHEPK